MKPAELSLGNATVGPIMIDDPSIPYDIKQYSFARALKQEVTKLALGSGGMVNLFSDGLRIEGAALRIRMATPLCPASNG